MSVQTQIGDRLVWLASNGTAYRERNADGSKAKDQPYVSFRPVLRMRHADRERKPLPLRRSRKGNVIWGSLPRLSGY